MQWLVILLKLLSKLPTRLLHLLAIPIAFILHHIIGYRRKVVENNLKNAFEISDGQELNELILDFYKYLAHQIVETIKLWSVSKAELLSRVHFINPEKLERFEHSDQSVIIMMGHSGNWEWAGLATAARFNFKTIPVYRRLKDRAFDKFYRQLRGRFNAEPILDKDCSTQLPLKKSPCAVAMLADQSAGAKKGWWLNFLNKPTPFHRGSEVLARRLKGFDVVYAHVRRSGSGKYEIVLADPPKNWRDEQFSLTKGFAKFLESEIKKDQANWLWSHNRWKHNVPSGTQIID